MSETTIPYSPASGIHIVENFLCHLAVTDGLIGTNGWNISTIANAGTYAYLVAATDLPPSGGGLRTLTAANGSDGMALHMLANTVVLGSEGGSFRAKLRYPDISGNVLAGNNFRVGLDDSVTATDGTVGIVVTSAAGVLTLQADSATEGDFSDAITGVSTLTSGTTMVKGTWHEIFVAWSGENANGGPDHVVCYVDGELGAELKAVLIDNDELMEPKYVHYDNATSGTLELDISYLEFLLNR